MFHQQHVLAGDESRLTLIVDGNLVWLMNTHHQHLATDRQLRCRQFIGDDDELVGPAQLQDARGLIVERGIASHFGVSKNTFAGRLERLGRQLIGFFPRFFVGEAIGGKRERVAI